MHADYIKLEYLIKIYQLKMKQNLKSKENSSSFSNQHYGSTYRVESDQKDLILKNLRNESDNLRKNQDDYYRLNDQYRQLQHKYKALSEEKGNIDRDFKMRHEAAVRNICQLKNQIDAIKTELRDKRLEVNDLEADASSLKHQLEERTIELEKNRNQLKSSLADNEELLTEKQNLINNADKLKSILGQIQAEQRLLKDDNDSVNRRLDDLQKYHEQLQMQEKIVKEKIQAYQNQNNEMDANVNLVCDTLGELEIAVKRAQDEFHQLQAAIAELNAINEKFKCDTLHLQKNIQAEVLKNNAFGKALKNAEYTQKVRISQVEEANKEVEKLKDQIDGLDDVNQKLSEDLEACRAHLQNLGLINLKLVENLQNFSQEDEVARQMINRKKRVEYARDRVKETNGVYRESRKFMEDNLCSTSRRTYR